MPLTSANRVYKSFPNIFAENVTQHVKRRAESYRKHRTSLVLQNIDDDEVSEVCQTTATDDLEESLQVGQGQAQSRLTPEMRRLRTNIMSVNGTILPDSESETSSTATTPSTTPSTTPGTTPSTIPRTRASPSPRGALVNFIESPRPLSGGTFTPAFFVSPRKPRMSPRKPRMSPRTTCSLDNVDLWEESDSDVDLQELSSGTQLDVSKSVDVSSLRRSQSPIACKRNRLSGNETDKKLVEKRGARTAVKSRARVHRKLRNMFMHSRSPQPPSTIHENCENTTADDSERDENQKEIKPLLSNRRTKLTSSNVKSKQPVPVFTVKTDTSKLPIAQTQRNYVAFSSMRNRQSRLHCSDSIIETVSGDTQDDAIPFIVKSAIPRTNNLNMDKFERSKTEKLQRGNAGNNHSPSVSRHVKFNNFVTVRENESNTLDFLKKSSDTAKIFKTRYLKQNTERSGEIDPFIV